MKPASDHLHLGCGQTTPSGWVNVDGSWQVVLARHPKLKQLLVKLRVLPRAQAQIPWKADVMRLNLTAPLPFADGSFRSIFCSHTLEHLHYEDALRLLRECHRVLKKGGVCRFIVPDLESLVARYQEAKAAGDPQASSRFMEELYVHDKQRQRGALGMYYRLTSFHQHKWMYDSASLQDVFRQAGFMSVRQANYLDSRMERVAEVEDAGRILNGEGIVVEGTKE
jgi:predicted SAM-dependent methyltransferase